MKNKFSFLLALSALLVLTALPAQALSSQTEEIGFSASEVPKLISVSASLSFENLVPSHLYSAPITVNWAVPDNALSNLAESEVIVRVKIEPRVNNSWIFFEKQGVRYKSAYTELHCFVENGKCAGNSTLSQTITAYYIAPLAAQYPHQDGLRVSAFLVPIGQAVLEAALENSASEQIASAEAKLKASAGEAAAQLRQLIEEAKALLAEKKFDELKQKLALLQSEAAQQQPSKKNGQEHANVNAVTGQKQAYATAKNVSLEKEEGAGGAPEEAAGGVPSPQKGGATRATGLSINSSTASAAGGVALVILAMLAFAATRNNKAGRGGPANKNISWQEEEKHEMGAKP